jgi:hypothetical protein
MGYVGWETDANRELTQTLKDREEIGVTMKIGIWASMNTYH